MEMPEKLWARPPTTTTPERWFAVGPASDCTEYIRADIHKARVEELERDLEAALIQADNGRRAVQVEYIRADIHNARVEELEAWKASAMTVMGEWDRVYDALGKPGKPGGSMALASLAEVERLRKENARLIIVKPQDMYIPVEGKHYSGPEDREWMDAPMGPPKDGDEKERD